MAHSSGMEELDVTLFSLPKGLPNGIISHGDTLKRLKLFMAVADLPHRPFMTAILGACQCLESFEYVDEACGGTLRLDGLIDAKSWKEPASLKSISVTGERMCIEHISSSVIRLDWKMSTITATPNRELIHGWKVLKSIKVHSDDFLDALFERAQDFSQLCSITLNGTVYGRVVS
jgi:hypothetical protein